MVEYSSVSDLECSYSYNAYGYYTCMTMNLKLEKENALIESVKGQHLPGKEQINVEGLLFVRSNNEFLSSDIFEKFPNLKVLSMLFFSVENIVQGNFDGAQKLEYIYLNNNGIPKLNDNIFSGATKLIRIEMKMNGISSISKLSFAGLTTLEQINLDHNHLKSLPKGIFDDLINLKSLSLYGNIIQTLDGDLFKNNLKLIKLWLSNNHLSIIGSNLITHLESLKIAYFYNNPCISTSLYDAVNSNVLIKEIAKCTESNKPEQKLIIAELEKDKTTEKNNLLNKVITKLNKNVLEQLQQNGVLMQNVKVLHQNVESLNKNNTDLNKSVTEKLQKNGALMQNVELLQQKLNSNAESNQQKLNKFNEELKYCQNEIKKSQFAFKFFH